MTPALYHAEHLYRTGILDLVKNLELFVRLHFENEGNTSSQQ